MYSGDESLNHFSLSVFPVGTTQKVPSCKGLEGISLDTQFMQSETPHHLDFAGLNRRENVLFQDIFWGGFLQNPTALKMEIFENMTSVTHWCSRLDTSTGSLCRQGSRMKWCVLLSGRCLRELVCPKKGEQSQEITVAEVPTEVSMSHSYTDRLRLGMFH